VQVVLNYFESRSRAFLVSFGFSLIVLLGCLDYVIGHEASLGVFYLFPTAIVAYFTGRRLGIAAAICSTMIWLVSDMLAGQVYSQPLLLLWSGLGKTIVFIAVAVPFSGLRDAYLQQKKLARTDHLTQAVNSRAFYEVAEMELQRSRRYRRTMTVAFIDLDNFKAVNDVHGHNCGDELLQSVARTIRNNTRRTDTVARLGGDEFAILMPETGQRAAFVAIQKIKEELAAEANQKSLPVGFSIGVLTCEDVPRSAKEMVAIADKLMYEIKHSGKNGIKHQVLRLQYVTQPVTDIERYGELEKEAVESQEAV